MENVMQSNKNKSWVKDGEQLVANYLGERVFGKVVESRVKYGGRVQYTVDLDKPVKFRWRSEPTVRVLVDERDLIEENV
jgi:hypothetical protein